MLPFTEPLTFFQVLFYTVVFYEKAKGNDLWLGCCTMSTEVAHLKGEGGKKGVGWDNQSA